MRAGSRLTPRTYVHQIALMKDEIRRLSELVQSFLNYGKPIEIHPSPADLRGNR